MAGAGQSLFLDALKRLSRNRLAVAGGVVIFALAFVSAFPSLFSAIDPSLIDTGNMLASPSALHPLGTDETGPLEVWLEEPVKDLPTGKFANLAIRH